MVLVVGMGILYWAANLGLQLSVLARYSLEMDAEWNRSYKDAAFHLQTFALTGAERDWEAYERALLYPRAARAGIRTAAEFPGDGARMRAALEGGPVPEEDVEYWVSLAEGYGAEEWYQQVARARVEKDDMLVQLEEQADRLRAIVSDEGAATPATLAPAEAIRALDDRFEEIERPFWYTILAAIQTGETAMRWTLVGTTLGVILGGSAVIAVGAARTRRRERQLVESEARFREIAETVVGIVWVMDRDRRTFLYLSPGFEDIWRRPRESLMSNPDAWMEWVHPDDREVALAAMAQEPDEPVSTEFRIVRPSGEIRHVRSRLLPIRDEEGGIPRFVGFAEDVTTDRDLEQEIVRSQQLRSVGRLAGGIAHEFNNLLTVAQGHIQLLIADHQQDAATVADLNEALKATRRAGELTRDLLSFAGRQILQLRPVDLSHFIDGSRPMLKSFLPAGVQLETSFPTDLLVRADPTYLRELLLTLVQFCAHRIPERGDVIVRVESVVTSEPIRVEGGKLPPGRWGVLVVEDTGGPIPAKLRDRIFEPFGTAESVAFSAHLGMAAAHGIAEQSGGGIRVEEGDRGGLRFLAYFRGIEPSSAGESPRVGGAASRNSDVER